jgi:hypothetical protein
MNNNLYKILLVILTLLVFYYILSSKYVEKFKERGGIDQILTIGIKTFMRPKALEFCLKNIINLYPNINIIISDDSPDNYKVYNKKVIDKFSGINKNIKHILLPFDSGLSFGRNKFVELCKTKYILVLDDSRTITYKTKLEKMVEFLEDTDYDLIGGIIPERRGVHSHYSKNFKKVYNLNDKIYVDYTTKLKKINYHKLNVEETNMTLNVFVARTDKLKKYPWNNKLKLGEHSIFFYDWYINQNKCAISKECIFLQAPMSLRRYSDPSYRDRAKNIYKLDNIVFKEVE